MGKFFLTCNDLVTLLLIFPNEARVQEEEDSTKYVDDSAQEHRVLQCL